MEKSESPTITKPPKEKIGRIKKALKTATVVTTATVALGGIGKLIVDDVRDITSRGTIENPSPFPVISQSPDDLKYHELSRDEQYNVWDGSEGDLSNSRQIVLNDVETFLHRVLAVNAEGRNNGPRVTVIRSTGKPEYTGIVPKHTWQRNGLDDGSLQSTRFRIMNDDEDSSNNHVLDIEVEGLFMNSDKTRYDIEQSNFTHLRVVDRDAKIYDGTDTIMEFYRNPNGGMDVVILRQNEGEGPKPVFDSRHSEFDVDRSPGEASMWLQTAGTMLTDIADVYGLGILQPKLNPKVPTSK